MIPIRCNANAYAMHLPAMFARSGLVRRRSHDFEAHNPKVAGQISPDSERLTSPEMLLIPGAFGYWRDGYELR